MTKRVGLPQKGLKRTLVPAGMLRALPTFVVPRLPRVIAAASTLALSAGLAGCASAPPARHVKLADLATLGPITLEQPIVIEFQEGDVIPLDFSLAGPFLETPKDAPPIPLRARRHFFLRVYKDGLKASADGKDFDKKPAVPGRFQVGIGVRKGEGPKANVSIRTPTPEGLPVD